MNLAQLLGAVRDVIDDAAGFQLLTDETLTRYLNNAVLEAAIRTRTLQDSESAACSITLVVGQARYELNKKIIVVRAAFVPDRRDGLVLTKASKLDCIAPGWAHQVQQNSVPRYAVFDVSGKAITLHPPPDKVGNMKLRVWRLPFEEEEMQVGEPTGEPVLDLPDPESLKHWAAFEVYNHKDSEAYDPERAKYHYGIFEDIYGPRPTNHALQLWSTSRIVGQRMHSEF